MTSKNRPRVMIDAPNLSGSLRDHMRETVRGLQVLPGVAGVMLNGGISRGYADELSEIDLTLFLEPDTFAKWQNGRAPLTLGICKIRGQLYDLKIVDVAREQSRSWDRVELWDLSYAEILYDPQGALAALKADKLSTPPSPAEAEGPLFSCWWNFRLAGDIWLKRGDPLQGHYMLNHAAASLLEALFLVNGEYIPHAKWIVHLSRTLQWTPDDWRTRLSAAMSTGDLSTASVRARQAAIELLWNEVDEYCRSICSPDLPLRMMQKTFYDLFRLLVEKDTVLLEDWERAAPLAVLNSDPFHRLVAVEGNRIILDRDALRTIKPEDMYTWHYQVLRAAAQDGLENV